MGVGLISYSCWGEEPAGGNGRFFAISKLKLYQDSESRLKEKEKKNSFLLFIYKI